MRERQILFSGEMVRAILEGLKTQTRRVMKPQPSSDFAPIAVEWYAPTVVDRDGEEQPGVEIFGVYGEEEGYRCPYGVPGDRLWVRETWAIDKKYDKYPGSKVPKAGRGRVWYLSDWKKPKWAGRTRSSRFMPRWASRITLEIVSVRVERVKEITTQDCEAEGVGYNLNEIGWRYAFGQLWNAINEKRGFGWDVNPWVWVIEFRKVEQ